MYVCMYINESYKLHILAIGYTPPGKPKGNLMRGNKVLIFSKIISNNFFVNHVSSCDCVPFRMLLLP